MSKIYTFDELKKLSTSELNKVKAEKAEELLNAENLSNKAVLCQTILQLQAKALNFIENAKAVEDRTK